MPPITPEQIVLVKSSWTLVLKQVDEAGTFFYQRVFELDPRLRTLFIGDITEQTSKLISTLNLAISSLTNLDKILPFIRELGVRHIAYGVREQDYTIISQALTDTLKKYLGDDFTPEVKSAWLNVYNIIKTEMISAAQSYTKL